jgi:osmotically inducible lipoprotein OsmB
MRMYAKTKSVILASILALCLAGCGTTPGDRALSGGMLGAGTGALIGSIAGSAADGALFGGLGGLALGALTSPDTVNLGEPVWNHHAANSSRHRTTARNDEHCTTRETATARITTCPKR